MNPNPFENQEEFDYEAQLIYQRGFGVATSKTETEKLGSSAGPCRVVVFSSPQDEFLIVAHFDTLTKVQESLATILSWIKHYNINLEDLSTTMLCGDKSSINLHHELKNNLKLFGFDNVNDLNPDSETNGGPRKFIVSKKDGVIVPGKMPAKPEDSEIRTAKMAKSLSRQRSTLVLEEVD